MLGKHDPPASSCVMRLIARECDLAKLLVAIPHDVCPVVIRTRFNKDASESYHLDGIRDYCTMAQDTDIQTLRPCRSSHLRVLQCHRDRL